MLNRFEARLKTQKEVIDFCRTMLSNEESTKYLDKVYSLLLAIAPGDKLKFENIVKAVNMDMFIKCACLFICEHPNTYCFSNDYQYVEHRTTTII